MKTKEFALVTGASGDIGQAVCEKLAKMGMNLIIHYNRSHERAQSVLRNIEKTGVHAELLKFDVSDCRSVEESLKVWIRKNPSFQISVVVHNAGIRRDKLMAFLSPQEWEQTISVNLNSFYFVIHPLLKKMISARKGSIIVVSSVSGIEGMPGQVHYSASKAGLIGASKALSKELGQMNIRVNVIAPGFIDGRMTGDIDRKKMIKSTALKRLGNPEEIADVAAYLAGENSSFLTGQVIVADGGRMPVL